MDKSRFPQTPKILLILYHFFQSHCLFCYLCMNHQLPSPPSSYSSSFDRFGCAVVAHQGRIYVSGGFGQDKVNFPSHDYPDQSILNHLDVQAILSSVECYDPETDKWTKLVHMKKVGKPLLLLSNIQCLTCRCVASWVECWWTDQSILTPSSTLELICPSFASTCRVIF